MKNAFIFDIDDTIYDQQQAFERALNNQFKELTNHINRTTLYKLMREYGDETFATTGFDKHKLQSMQIFRIQRALADYQILIGDKQAIQFQLDFEFFQKDITLFPDVKRLFDLLAAKNITLGIITNGTIEKQAAKIVKLELERWIDPKYMLISEKAGCSKPDCRIFEIFQGKLPVEKENVYYVGDNFFNDIVGAKRSGWKAIWTNYRNHFSTEEDFQADITVRSPQELFSAVQKIL